MDKQTISHYGWIIVVTMIMSVMLAFATPFGQFVGKAVYNSVEGLGETSEKAISEENIQEMENKWNDKIEDMATDTKLIHLKQSGIIPEGGKYYTNVTSKNDLTISGYTEEIIAGEEFPVPSDGDVYIYEDYQYRYNYAKNSYNGGKCEWTYTGSNGWGVSVIDNSKSNYATPLISINERDVTDLSMTYNNCQSLIEAPELPPKATIMDGTFNSCTSLTTVTTIPKYVTSMNSTFYECTSLTEISELPKSLTNMEGTFANCTALTTSPRIPENVTNMNSTFAGCTVLTVAPEIPSKVNNLKQTFLGCKSMVNAPALPSTVTELDHTFEGCEALTTAPEIPSSITSMISTFQNCKSLTTAPPTLPEGLEILWGTFWGCESIKNAPEIPTSIKDMEYSFRGCKSLTGTIKIKTNSTKCNQMFYLVDFKAQNLKLTGSSSQIDTYGATGKNYCAICNGGCSETH
jgi:hypothetical protein